MSSSSSTTPLEMAAAASGGGCGEKEKAKSKECEMTERQAAAGCALAGRLPKRIILVRHGKCQGNVTEAAYATTADHSIALTELGVIQANTADHSIALTELGVIQASTADHSIALTELGVIQARTAGQRILDVVSSASASEAPNWKVYFYPSPYERGRATLREICAAFPRERVIGGDEDWRGLQDVEQVLGNIQDVEQMSVRMRDHEGFGRFFYHFPEGESGADIYVRVARFMGSLWRDINQGRLEQDGDASGETNLNLVIVSRGLDSRVFMTKWFKWTVQEFEGLTNITNGEVRVMQLGPGGEYSFLPHHTTEHLRSWGFSPRMIADQERRASANGNEDPPPPPPPDNNDDDGAGPRSAPCAACKMFRRRCTRNCPLSPFFPGSQPEKFASVHTVFELHGL